MCAYGKPFSLLHIRIKPFKKHCRLIRSVLCFAKLIDALPEFQIRIEALLSQV
jgi:hypothetical protein